MEKWGGKRTGEILSDALINIDLDKFDCLILWLEDYLYNDIQEEFANEIYRSGLSKEAHDMRNDMLYRDIIRKENKKYNNMLKMEFTLTKSELDREEEISLGTIKMARSGKDLFDISENMHNCVFRLYTEKVNKKLCTIYYLQKYDEYLACIEVVNGAVIQAYGKYNSVLNGEVRAAVKDWCVRKNLEFTPMK